MQIGLDKPGILPYTDMYIEKRQRREEDAVCFGAESLRVVQAGLGRGVYTGPRAACLKAGFLAIGQAVWRRYWPGLVRGF